MLPKSVTLIILLISTVYAGPLTFAACQSACNYGAVVCYAKAGLVFGTVTLTSAASGPIGWWAWLVSNPVAWAAACSTAQGTCMAACTPLLIAPTP